MRTRMMEIQRNIADIGSRLRAQIRCDSRNPSLRQYNNALHYSCYRITTDEAITLIKNTDSYEPIQ